jgi:nucleoside transporter
MMPTVLLAEAGFFDSVRSFLTFVTAHWQFCLLHFLEFAIWGAWIVVLGNLLNARGFSRKEIGRIYGTMPIGSMISPLIIGPLADKYFNTEILIGGSHLIGAVLLYLMAQAKNPRPFYWFAFIYALAYAPTLGLVNSIVFSHDQDIFGGAAEEGFPWIRVFGTLGWIVAGLSHALILKKDEPVNERPLLLACVLSVVLGLFAFTLPSTPPAGAVDQPAAQTEETAAAPAASATAAAEPAKLGIIEGSVTMLSTHPVFFLVTFVASMAMGLYFAFAALFLEKSGVRPNVVGPVMTIGQWIEIFFMLSLPWFLGPKNIHMNFVLLAGICAWAIRFGLFAIGRPLPLVLFGIAIHGICFDFFFAAGFINTNSIAPEGLTATAQTLYGFLVYGLGMYLGSEGSGWLNQYFSKTEEGEDGKKEIVTNWRAFWLIPCVMVAIGAAMFWFTIGSSNTDNEPDQDQTVQSAAGETEFAKPTSVPL